MITTSGVDDRGACNSAAWRIAAAHRFRPAALALLAGLSLTACADAGTQGTAGLPPVAAAAPVPADPLLAFAATAAPGSESMIVSARTGRPMRVRMLRAYDAASGRPCHEVLVGSGLDERARLLCQNEGSWVEARPLLRGGGTARP
jgi:hypothetical protein